MSAVNRVTGAVTESVTNVGIGLKGLRVADIITRFYGELSRWPTEPDGRNPTQAEIVKLAEHISLTGDCLWHAQTVVFGWKACHCARCDPQDRTGLHRFNKVAQKGGRP